jgi:hypothetical protein
MCAGQGRDLLGALAGHPRRGDVRARLVELDPRNTAYARSAAKAAGLDRIEVLTADAALTDHYRDVAPADIVLVCGLFANLTDDDVRHTVDHCPRAVRKRWHRHLDPAPCHARPGAVGLRLIPATRLRTGVAVGDPRCPAGRGR